MADVKVVSPEGVAEEVLAEFYRAVSRFGPFASRHEGIAVIREEYLELERAVFWGDGGPENVRVEAIQLAAMALRFVYDVGGET